MKKSIVTLVVLLISLSVFSQAPEEVRKSIHDNYTAAFADENLEAISKLYTEDASIHNIDGTVYTGKSEIMAAYKAYFEAGDSTIEIKGKENEVLADGLMFSFDHFKLKSKSTDDKIKGEVVNLYKMEDGKWKIYKSYRWAKPETPKEDK